MASEARSRLDSMVWWRRPAGRRSDNRHSAQSHRGEVPLVRSMRLAVHQVWGEVYRVPWLCWFDGHADKRKTGLQIAEHEAWEACIYGICISIRAVLSCCTAVHYCKSMERKRKVCSKAKARQRQKHGSQHLSCRSDVLLHFRTGFCIIDML